MIDTANALYSKLCTQGSSGLKETGILIDSGKLTILSPHQKCDIKHWILEITRADIHDDSFPQIAQLFSKILIPKWSVA